MAIRHLCKIMSITLYIFTGLQSFKLHAVEKGLFSSQRDLVVGEETDFAQRESAGQQGYDLATHNHDITQYKRDWFDLTCQFRSKEGAKWIHVVDRSGAPVDEQSISSYCDNTLAGSALGVPERYLLLGYTPFSADARDGTALQKNFAVLMRGFIRQDIAFDTQKNSEAQFVIDGYLFDRRLSRLLPASSRNQKAAPKESLCAHIFKLPMAKEGATTRGEEILKFLKEGGISFDGAGGAQLSGEIAAGGGEDLLARMRQVCQMQGGAPIEMASGYDRIDSFLKSPAAVTTAGSYHVASFGRDLFSGSLRLSSGVSVPRVSPCRYLHISPGMSSESDPTTLLAEGGGIMATMAAKVCYDSYIHLERTAKLEMTADCSPSFTMGCVPDHSSSLMVDPWAAVTLGLFDKNGMTAVNILEGRPRGEDLLELIKFNMAAMASSAYRRIDATRRLVVSSIDYDISLDALRGKLGIHLVNSLAPIADTLFASMVNSVKIWDKAAQIPTTLSDFKTNYIDLEKSFDLVKFPEKMAWKRTTRLNPLVFYLDGPSGVRTSLHKDGCGCFKALGGLVDVRGSLLRHLGCLASRSVGDDRREPPASHRAETLALFGGIEETCLNYLGSDECADKGAYLDKKSQVLVTGPTLNPCEDKRTPEIFGQGTR